ncbi:MAG: sensor histidine kinase, partial [Bacteroidota bacterium]
ISNFFKPKVMYTDFMSKKHVFLLIFLVMSLLPSFGDDKKDLFKPEEEETLNVYTGKAADYLDLAWEYVEKNVVISKSYADSSLYYARLSQDSFAVSLAYNVMGRAAGIEGEGKRALQYYLQGLALRQSLFDNAVAKREGEAIEFFHINLAGSHINAGNGYRNLGNYPEAISHFKDAEHIYGQYDLPSKLAKIKRNLALTYEEAGDVSKAIALHNEAIQFYRAVDMPAELAKTLVASAQTHMDFDLCQDASEQLMEAYALFLDLEEPENAQRALFEMAANNYSCLQKLEEAKDQFLAIIASEDLAYTPDLEMNATYNLAEVYAEMDHYDSAYIFFQKFLTIISPEKDTLDLLKTYLSMGEMSLLAGDTIASREVYQEIRALTAKKLPQYLGYEAYKYLSQVAHIQQEYQRAFEYSKLSNQYLDSLNRENKESYQLLRELDKEKSIAENQKRVDSIVQSFLGGAIILLVVVFVLMFRGARARQHNAELMEEVNNIMKNQEAQRFDALLKGQEAERTRIARTLHDSVGPTLQTLKLNLHTINQRLNIVQEETNAKVLAANDLLDNAMNQIRNLSHDLSKEMLMKVGILEAIREFAQKVQNSSQINVSIEPFGFKDGEGRLSTKMELLLFRMVQELIGNAIKHGKAENITIRLNRFDDLVNLMVTDDGVGFDYAKIKETKSGGIGLHGFELHVEELGGKLRVDSIPHRETTINIDIPLVHKTEHSKKDQG